MLEEFPAHLFGMEGPQACLLLASILGAIAFAIPLLDRNAAKGKPSPLFTDLGVAGILFLGFLTLKAWDVGVHAPPGKDPAGDPAMAAMIARTAALWILGIGGAATALRRLRWRHSAFSFTAAVLLQAALNGFAHLSWLTSGGVALACARRPPDRGARSRRGRRGALCSSRFSRLRGPRGPRRRKKAGREGGAPATTAAPAPGHVAEGAWPADFQKFFAEVDKKTGPVLSDKAKARFRTLPSHAQELFFAATRAGTVSSAAHLAALLALEIDDRKVELILGDNCVLCHSNPDLPDEILFRARQKGDPNAHLDLNEVVSDVHFRGGLMCSGCHGGKPTDAEMSRRTSRKRWPEGEKRKKDRSWIPEFCARCHSSSEFMRRLQPGAPRRPAAEVPDEQARTAAPREEGLEGRAVRELPRRARDPPPDSASSLVYRENVPTTCGKCHADAAYMKGYTLDDGETPLPTNQLEQYRKSVHGLALLGSTTPALPRATAAMATTRRCRPRRPVRVAGLPHLPRRQRQPLRRQPAQEGVRGARLARMRDLPREARHRGADGRDAGRRPKALCHACHAQYGKPKCDETARYFHDIDRRASRAATAALGKDVDRLAERGFEVDELRFQASAASERAPQDPPRRSTRSTGATSRATRRRPRRRSPASRTARSPCGRSTGSGGTGLHPRQRVDLAVRDPALPEDPTDRSRALTAMDDSGPGLAQRVAELAESLRSVEARLAALEGAAAPPRPGPVSAPPAAPLPAAVVATGMSAPSYAALLGKALFVLAGAFLRAGSHGLGRAFPRGAGVALGLAYAATWLVVADRAGRAVFAVRRDGRDDLGNHGARHRMSPRLGGVHAVRRAAGRGAAAVLFAVAAAALAVSTGRRSAGSGLGCGALDPRDRDRALIATTHALVVWCAFLVAHAGVDVGGLGRAGWPASSLGAGDRGGPRRARADLDRVAPRRPSRGPRGPLEGLSVLALALGLFAAPLAGGRDARSAAGSGPEAAPDAFEVAQWGAALIVVCFAFSRLVPVAGIPPSLFWVAAGLALAVVPSRVVGPNSPVNGAILLLGAAFDSGLVAFAGRAFLGPPVADLPPLDAVLVVTAAAASRPLLARSARSGSGGRVVRGTMLALACAVIAGGAAFAERELAALVAPDGDPAALTACEAPSSRRSRCCLRRAGASPRSPASRASDIRVSFSPRSSSSSRTSRAGDPARSWRRSSCTAPPVVRAEDPAARRGTGGTADRFAP